ncbi:MAG: primosomal protein N' [Proteobacteria bacterium]|nr:primosomal protein N' [Pseudomonadota bacterium]
MENSGGLIPHNKIIVTVLLPLPFDHGFSYFADANLHLKVGDMVQVPFRKKEIYGVVVAVDDKVDFDHKKIKSIIKKDENLHISDKLLKLVQWAANYNLAPQGLMLKLAISTVNSAANKVKKKQEKQFGQPQIDDLKLKELSDSQKQAADFLNQRIVDNQYSVTLIDGITGSGKTEVYFASIAKILQQDQEGQILILLPEIILTTQLIDRFTEQFGFAPQIWHSKVGESKKRDIFYGINNGKIRVLIGARSALFLPFKQLRLIIVDEEHEASFKQEDLVNYHGRDMAIVRAKMEEIPIFLASATPSLESYLNAKNGKYHHLVLDQRFAKNQHIEIDLVDMRQKKLPSGSCISAALVKQLGQALAENKQSLLFLNRRGYSPLTLCKACGYKVVCPNCSSYATYHYKNHRLICHHCGLQNSLPNDCPQCHETDSLITCGAGVEKVEEEVLQHFPQSRIALMTSDNVTNLQEAEELVNKILNHEIDVIIGTQIIAKGHHFPDLALVGIIDGDGSFQNANLRTAERSYQLLTQVIGRAGRDKYQGKVVLQSYNPQNVVFKNIINNDRDKFLESEANNRQIMNMPPFSKMVAVIFNAFDEEQTIKTAKMVLQQFPVQSDIEVFGPAPMPLTKVRNRYYYRLLIKAENRLNIQKLIAQVLAKITVPSTVRIKVDIDPA